MFSLRWFSRSILSFLVLTMLVTTAMSGESAKPSGKVTMESKSIAAGIGVTWGDGKLNFKGKDYPFSIDGMTVVDFGISKASANGDVYNLTDVAKAPTASFLSVRSLATPSCWLFRARPRQFCCRPCL